MSEATALPQFIRASWFSRVFVSPSPPHPFPSLVQIFCFPVIVFVFRFCCCCRFIFLLFRIKKFFIEFCFSVSPFPNPSCLWSFLLFHVLLNKCRLALLLPSPFALLESRSWNFYHLTLTTWLSGTRRRLNQSKGACVSFNVCVWVYLRQRDRVCLSVCVWVFVWESVHDYVHVCVNVFVFVSVWFCVLCSAWSAGSGFDSMSK